jgi:hypothetical protein
VSGAAAVRRAATMRYLGGRAAAAVAVRVIQSSVLGIGEREREFTDVHSITKVKSGIKIQKGCLRRVKNITFGAQLRFKFYRALMIIL